MSFFTHTIFMASFVGMILHFWRQLPLVEGESPAGRLREFMEWSGKGVGVPLAVWIFMNLGLTTWLPPFLPEVDVAKNAGGFWPWAVLLYSCPAMSVIVSYWAALSLIFLALLIRSRTEDLPGFNTTLITWGFFMLPAGAVSLWLAGWAGAGFALVLWFAPVVYGTLPQMVAVHRAPSYSQAIAKIKFGKFSEAELEVIKELEQCENDFNGWMMLAELYAVHFHDFKQAEQTVIDLCEQPDITPSDACVALHRLADWHLQLQNDPRGARRCMEAISQRYPRSHLDRMARLRLRRIPHTAEEWIEECRSKPLHLPALHDELEDPEIAEPVDVDQLRQSAEVLTQKLARDPNDVRAREEFARLLAQLDKWEAAIDQVGLLLAMEGQMLSRRAEWMGLKAAWMLKLTPESPEVQKVLRRIIQEFPLSPQAMAAQRRIFLLEERIRVAKYAARPKKPRIVIRLDEPAGESGTDSANRV
jgi:hypothetical protein